MFARILYVCVYWVTIQTEQRSDDYVIRIPYAAAQLTSRPEITAISELRSNANEDSQSNSTHTRRDAPADVTSATNASVRFKMHYSAAASQEKSRQHRDENLSKREIKRAKNISSSNELSANPMMSSPPNDSRRDVWILGLFPLNGSWAGGLGQLPAVQMGIEDVNNDPTMLPGYRLRMTVNDTKVSMCMYVMVVGITTPYVRQRFDVHTYIYNYVLPFYT